MPSLSGVPGVNLWTLVSTLYSTTVCPTGYTIVFSSTKWILSLTSPLSPNMCLSPSGTQGVSMCHAYMYWITTSSSFDRLHRAGFLDLESARSSVTVIPRQQGRHRHGCCTLKLCTVFTVSTSSCLQNWSNQLRIALSCRGQGGNVNITPVSLCEAAQTPASPNLHIQAAGIGCREVASEAYKPARSGCRTVYKLKGVSMV